jgi:hypothetical protein
MAAASRGAHRARGYREGDVIGVLPGGDRAAANRWVDVAIPTGLGVARNVLVVQAADAVIAIGGRAGTLSELALAWQLGRPVVALDVPGWSARVAGRAIDDRRPKFVSAPATRTSRRARDVGLGCALAGVPARRRAGSREEVFERGSRRAVDGRDGPVVEARGWSSLRQPGRRAGIDLACGAGSASGCRGQRAGKRPPWHSPSVSRRAAAPCAYRFEPARTEGVRARLGVCARTTTTTRKSA